MKIESFVLINVKTGTIKQVIGSLEKFKVVKFIASTAGKYDLIISLVVNSLEELHNFVTSELQKINGIAQTETQIIAKKIEK